MEKKDLLRNGPYLLSPTAHEITIAWELREEEAVVLHYGTETLSQSAVVRRQRLSVSKEDGEECFLCHARLTGMAADTEYRYSICVGTRLLVTASFRTLHEEPEQLHLLTISDTQIFRPHEAFTAMAKEERPDFILHGGDISFGTGYQHEQYEENWFQRIPAVLASTPVFYARGNHDDGPFFETLFTEPQAKSLNAAPDGHSFSMDYGIAHIVMVDSTPWGLFEMNAENAGCTLDAENRQRIQETLAWDERSGAGSTVAHPHDAPSLYGCVQQPPHCPPCRKVPRRSRRGRASPPLCQGGVGQSGDWGANGLRHAGQSAESG